VNYVYKMSAAIVLIPLLYVMHRLIERYLGRTTAEALRHEAASSRSAGHEHPAVPLP
jgi:hypothetical protein